MWIEKREDENWRVYWRQHGQRFSRVFVDECEARAFADRNEIPEEPAVVWASPLDGYQRAWVGSLEVAWIFKGPCWFNYWWRGKSSNGSGQLSSIPKGVGVADSAEEAFRKVNAELGKHWRLE